MAVAVVTGASRGIGRATAISLGERGYTVYLTGRSRGNDPGARTIDTTAGDVDDAGGRGIPVRCDHRDDRQIAALFAAVREAGEGCDLVVNNVFATDTEFGLAEQNFFDVPPGAVDDMLTVGVRAHYVASWHAVKLMRAQQRGLIVNISSAGAVYPAISPAYCIAKAALDKFTLDAALQLKPLGIGMLSLWPGPLVGTELALALHRDGAAITETPFLTGRAVAWLAGHPDVMRFSGRVLVAADVAAAADLPDADGARPAYPFDDAQIARQLLRRVPLRLAADD